MLKASRNAMPRFFAMSRGDRAYLAALLLFAVLAFLPVTREVSIAGLALFGWLMAALMVVAPLAALFRLLAGRRKESNGG